MEFPETGLGHDIMPSIPRLTKWGTSTHVAPWWEKIAFLIIENIEAKFPQAYLFRISS